jgi:hypothetical protein
MTWRLTVALGLIGAVTVLTGTGCGVQGLNFRQDTRLEIYEPEDRATDLELPIAIDWEITDFDITGPGGPAREDAGYFAVFVDRRPQPPGQPLAWLARDDETCVEARGCPNEEYFADRGVHTTTDTEFVLESLPDTDDYFHEVTVILLDSEGKRLGESAFAVEFRTRDSD